MRRIVHGTCLVLLAGCGWQPDEATLATRTRLPAAALAPLGEATPLEEMLAILDRELRAAIDGELQGEAEQALLRGEAITDRLLEARLPFHWLHADQYNLDARLRQIQSQADRAVAALLSGQPRDLVLEETRLLLVQVTSLRETLQEGGGPPRVPVDRLIEALDTIRRPAEPAPATAAPSPVPLGTPVAPAAPTDTTTS